MYKKESKSVKNFISKSKEVTYHIVRTEDFYDFFEKIDDCDWRNLIPDYRDYAFALNKNKVVGFAIMADSSKTIFKYDDVITLSNIEVKENFRNQGIASRLIDIVIEDVKNRNKILRRTSPEPDGKKYIFEQITQKTKQNNIPCIPHNLDFIYKNLNSLKFKNKQYTPKQKIDLLYTVAQAILDDPEIKKEDNIKTFDDLNSSMMILRDNAIEKVLKKTKKKSKFKP